MREILLIDFGATRIKTAIVDIESGLFSRIGSFASFQNCSNVKGRYEIDVNDIKATFNNICRHYYKEHGIKFHGICVCSQMHGFIVAGDDGVVKSNYISWKDERSLENIDNKDSFSLASEIAGTAYREITGMKPRPGLPFFNVLHMARAGTIEDNSKIISIPEYIAICNGKSQCCIHPTMCAGLGFYNINNNEISKDLMGIFKEISGISLSFNRIAEVDTVSGYCSIDTEKIPIYTGVGDHQCAVLGACNIPGKTISINLGTGSQVAMIDQDKVTPDVEFRPYFNGSKLSTITHIPSGRVLSEFIDFINSVIVGFGGSGNVWERIALYSAEQVINSSLEFNLGLFQSAWNYSGGGSIMGISEGALSLDNFLCSLVKCYMQQYIDVIGCIDSEKSADVCILSGGIPKNIPVIKEVLERMSGKRVTGPMRIDETFAGLRTIALISEKHSVNYMHAQNIYGRKCYVE